MSLVKIDSGRRNNFNILRFIAATMVIYGHMFPILGVPSFTLFNQNVSTIAVKIFMLISGYLITESYLRDKNVIRYGIKRVFRIFPALIFCIAITTLIIGPILTSLPVKEYFNNEITWSYLKNNILLSPFYALPGVFEKNIYKSAVNGSLWTLPVEFALYIIFPFIIWVFSKLKIKKIIYIVITILSCIALLVYLKYFHGSVFVVYGSNVFDALTIAPYFFIGGVFSLVSLKKYLNLQVATVAMFIFASISLSTVKMEILTLIVLSYFVFSFAFCENPFFYKWFSKNDYSYGIYLWGFLTQQTLVKLLIGYNVKFNIYVLLSVIIAFACAFVSWHLIEKPAQKLGKFLIKKHSIISKKQVHIINNKKDEDEKTEDKQETYKYV